MGIFFEGPLIIWSPVQYNFKRASIYRVYTGKYTYARKCWYTNSPVEYHFFSNRQYDKGKKYKIKAVVKNRNLEFFRQYVI